MNGPKGAMRGTRPRNAETARAKVSFRPAIIYRVYLPRAHLKNSKLIKTFGGRGFVNSLTSLRRGSSGMTNVTAVWQALAQHVQEQKMSGDNMWLALRATGGGLRPMSAFSSYYYYYYYIYITLDIKKN